MTADVSHLIQHLAEHSHAPEQVAGPPCSLHNQNTDCENCLTKPCTSDTSTFSTPCEDANLTAESSVSIEPCRTYTPLSTNVCRIATANHKIDMTTQRSDAALIRDVTVAAFSRRFVAPLSCSSFSSTQTEPSMPGWRARSDTPEWVSTSGNLCMCRSLALHVPTASSTRCSQRSRKPPNTKEKRTQESIAPNKLRVATLGFHLRS